MEDQEQDTVTKILNRADNYAGELKNMLNNPTAGATPQMRIPQPNNGNNGNNGGSTFTIKQNIRTPEAAELRANTYSQNVNTFAKEYDRLMDRLNMFTADVTGTNGKLGRFRATADKFRARSDVPMIVTAAMDVINEYSKLQKDYAQFFMYAEQWNSRQCDVIETLKAELDDKVNDNARIQRETGRLMQLIDSMALYVIEDNIPDHLKMKDERGNIRYVNVIANIQKQLADYAAKLKFFDDYKKQIADLEDEKKALTDKVASMKSELSAKDIKIDELNDKYSILEKGLAEKVNLLCRTLNRAANADDSGEPWEAPEHYPHHKQPQPIPQPTSPKPYSSINPVQELPAQFSRNSSAQAPTPPPATTTTTNTTTNSTTTIANSIEPDESDSHREFEVVPEEPELPVNYDGDDEDEDEDADIDKKKDSNTIINSDNGGDDLESHTSPISTKPKRIPLVINPIVLDGLKPIERLLLQKLNNYNADSCTKYELLRGTKNVSSAAFKKAIDKLIKLKLVRAMSSNKKKYYFMVDKDES